MKTDMTEVAAELTEHMNTLRTMVGDDAAGDYALCAVETFCAVAMRVLRKTNPSKVRDETRTVEIKARIDGIPVVRGLQ